MASGFVEPAWRARLARTHSHQREYLSEAPMNRRQLLRSAAAGLPLAVAPITAAAVQQKQIKITGMETDVLKRPGGAPYYDAIHTLGTESGSVVLRLRTDAGITGWANSSFGMIAGGPRVVQAILD